MMTSEVTCQKVSSSNSSQLNSIVNVTYDPYANIRCPVNSGSGQTAKIHTRYIPTYVFDVS